MIQHKKTEEGQIVILVLPVAKNVLWSLSRSLSLSHTHMHAHMHARMHALNFHVCALFLKASNSVIPSLTPNWAKSTFCVENMRMLKQESTPVLLPAVRFGPPHLLAKTSSTVNWRLTGL